MLDASRPKRLPSSSDTSAARPASDAASPTLPPRFPLAQFNSTPAALHLLIARRVDVFTLVLRHSQGNWGDVEGEDWAANDAALVEEGRLLSAYDLPGGAGRVWIITEADRSATTLLLPSKC